MPRTALPMSELMQLLPEGTKPGQHADASVHEEPAGGSDEGEEEKVEVETSDEEEDEESSAEVLADDSESSAAKAAGKQGEALEPDQGVSSVYVPPEQEPEAKLAKSNQWAKKVNALVTKVDEQDREIAALRAETDLLRGRTGRMQEELASVRKELNKRSNGDIERRLINLKNQFDRILLEKQRSRSV